MALPNTHRFRDIVSWANCTSVGATPVTCAIRMPHRGTIQKVGVITQGTITSTDGIQVGAVNGTANTNLNFTLPVAGAQVGQVASAVPSANVYVNEDDVVTFVSSGASGTTIAAQYFVVTRDTQ